MTKFVGLTKFQLFRARWGDFRWVCDPAAQFSMHRALPLQNLHDLDRTHSGLSRWFCECVNLICHVRKANLARVDLD